MMFTRASPSVDAVHGNVKGRDVLSAILYGTGCGDGDSHKADDFLQEAYYRFYRASKRHESEAHRRNSLFQIATNLVRDATRRGKHYEEVPLADDGSPSAGAVPKRADLTQEQAVTLITDAVVKWAGSLG